MGNTPPRVVPRPVNLQGPTKGGESLGRLNQMANGFDVALNALINNPEYGKMDTLGKRSSLLALMQDSNIRPSAEQAARTSHLIERLGELGSQRRSESNAFVRGMRASSLGSVGRAAGIVDEDAGGPESGGEFIPYIAGQLVGDLPTFAAGGAAGGLIGKGVGKVAGYLSAPAVKVVAPPAERVVGRVSSGALKGISEKVGHSAGAFGAVEALHGAADAKLKLNYIDKLNKNLGLPDFRKFHSDPDFLALSAQDRERLASFHATKIMQKLGLDPNGSLPTQHGEMSVGEIRNLLLADHPVIEGGVEGAKSGAALGAAFGTIVHPFERMAMVSRETARQARNAKAAAAPEIARQAGRDVVEDAARLEGNLGIDPLTKQFAKTQTPLTARQAQIVEDLTEPVRPVNISPPGAPAANLLPAAAPPAPRWRGRVAIEGREYPPLAQNLSASAADAANAEMQAQLSAIAKQDIANAAKSAAMGLGVAGVEGGTFVGLDAARAAAAGEQLTPEQIAAGGLLPLAMRGGAAALRVPSIPGRLRQPPLSPRLAPSNVPDVVQEGVGRARAMQAASDRMQALDLEDAEARAATKDDEQPKPATPEAPPQSNTPEAQHQRHVEGLREQAKQAFNDGDAVRMAELYNRIKEYENPEDFSGPPIQDLANIYVRSKSTDEILDVHEKTNNQISRLSEEKAKIKAAIPDLEGPQLDLAEARVARIDGMISAGKRFLNALEPRLKGAQHKGTPEEFAIESLPTADYGQKAPGPKPVSSLKDLMERLDASGKPETPTEIAKIAEDNNLSDADAMELFRRYLVHGKPPRTAEREPGGVGDISKSIIDTEIEARRDPYKHFIESLPTAEVEAPTKKTTKQLESEAKEYIDSLLNPNSREGKPRPPGLTDEDIAELTRRYLVHGAPPKTAKQVPSEAATEIARANKDPYEHQAENLPTVDVPKEKKTPKQLEVEAKEYVKNLTEPTSRKGEPRPPDVTDDAIEAYRKAMADGSPPSKIEATLNEAMKFMREERARIKAEKAGKADEAPTVEVAAPTETPKRAATSKSKAATAKKSEPAKPVATKGDILAARKLLNSLKKNMKPEEFKNGLREAQGGLDNLKSYLKSIGFDDATLGGKPEKPSTEVSGVDALEARLRRSFYNKEGVDLTDNHNPRVESLINNEIQHLAASGDADAITLRKRRIMEGWRGGWSGVSTSSKAKIFNSKSKPMSEVEFEKLNESKLIPMDEKMREKAQSSKPESVTTYAERPDTSFRTAKPNAKEYNEEDIDNSDTPTQGDALDAGRSAITGEKPMGKRKGKLSKSVNDLIFGDDGSIYPELATILAIPGASGLAMGLAGTIRLAATVKRGVKAAIERARPILNDFAQVIKDMFPVGGGRRGSVGWYDMTPEERVNQTIKGWSDKYDRDIEDKKADILKIEEDSKKLRKTISEKMDRRPDSFPGGRVHEHLLDRLDRNLAEIDNINKQISEISEKLKYVEWYYKNRKNGEYLSVDEILGGDIVFYNKYKSHLESLLKDEGGFSSTEMAALMPLIIAGAGVASLAVGAKGTAAALGAILAKPLIERVGVKAITKIAETVFPGENNPANISGVVNAVEVLDSVNRKSPLVHLFNRLAEANPEYGQYPVKVIASMFNRVMGRSYWESLEKFNGGENNNLAKHRKISGLYWYDDAGKRIEPTIDEVRSDVLPGSPMRKYAERKFSDASGHELWKDIVDNVLTGIVQGKPTKERSDLENDLIARYAIDRFFDLTGVQWKGMEIAPGRKSYRATPTPNARQTVSTIGDALIGIMPTMAGSVRQLGIGRALTDEERIEYERSRARLTLIPRFAYADNFGRKESGGMTVKAFYEAVKNDTDAKNRQSMRIINKIGRMDEEQKNLAAKYLRGEITKQELNKLSPENRDHADEMRGLISYFGKQMLDTGLLDKRSYDRFADHYIRETHLMKEDKDPRRVAASKFISAQFKRRGVERFVTEENSTKYTTKWAVDREENGRVFLKGPNGEEMETTPRMAAQYTQKWWAEDRIKEGKKKIKVSPQEAERYMQPWKKVGYDDVEQILSANHPARSKKQDVILFNEDMDPLDPDAFIAVKQSDEFKYTTDWVIDGDTLRSGDKVTIRRELTPEEHEKAGRVWDIEMALKRTVHDSLTNLMTGKFYSDVAENFSHPDNPTPGQAGYVKVPDDVMPGTSVKRYGKLSGRWIDATTALDLAQLGAMRESPDQNVNAFGSLIRNFKMNKTVRSTISQLSNFIGSPYVVVAAGGSWSGYFSRFGKMVEAAQFENMLDRGVEIDMSKPENIRRHIAYQEFEAARRAGAIDGTFSLEELRGDLIATPGPVDPFLNDFAATEATLMSATKSANERLAQYFKEVAGEGSSAKVNKTWTDPVTGRVFRPGDTVSMEEAMTNMYHQTDTVTRVELFTLAKAKGMDDREAARFARDNGVDYNYNAPLVNMMRNSVSPFALWTIRMAEVNGRMLRDRPLVALRVATTLGLMQFFGSIAMNWALGGNEDEERAALPDRMRAEKLLGADVLPDALKGRTMAGLAPSAIRFWPGVYLETSKVIPGFGLADVDERTGMPRILGSSVSPLAAMYETGMGRDPYTGKQIPKDERLKAIGKQWLPNTPSYMDSSLTKRIGEWMSGVESKTGDKMGLWEVLGLGSYVPPEASVRVTLGRHKREDSELAAAERSALEGKEPGSQGYTKTAMEWQNRRAALQQRHANELGGGK